MKDHERRKRGDDIVQTQRGQGLPVLAAHTFQLEGEVHKLITFLNQALKEQGLCFGLSKHEDTLQVTIYSTESATEETGKMT